MGEDPVTHRNPLYLSFIRSRPCLVCEATLEIEAAHVRVGGDGGVGLKPSDYRAVPLCHRHHAQQHRDGERTFWRWLGADPNAVIIHLIAAYLTETYGQWLVTGGPRVERRRAVIDALAGVVEGARDARKPPPPPPPPPRPPLSED